MAQITTTRNLSQWFHEKWAAGTGVTVGASGPEVKLCFHRALFMPSWRPYVSDLIAQLGWSTLDRIAVIGATFGMCEEILKADHSYTDVVSCDDSFWIQAAFSESEDADVAGSIAALSQNPWESDGLQARGEVMALEPGIGKRSCMPILNENLLTTTSRTNVKAALGSICDTIFTDDLIDYLTDAEFDNWRDEAAKSPMIGAVFHHAVGPAGGGDPPRPNAKGAEAWSNYRADDKFYDWNTSEVWQDGVKIN